MKITVLGDQGWAVLEESYGDDLAIVNAARQSFGRRSEELGESEKGLINFLMKNRHGTPFEMVDFRFVIRCPIFVAREWQRHRIASYNEMSGRYTELERDFYLPPVSAIRRQMGKPGAYEFVPVEEGLGIAARVDIRRAYDHAWDTYQSLLRAGVAKEIARVVLPVGIMTQFTFKVNLRSLFNFIALRSAPNALAEIREYADALWAFARSVAPVAVDAFERNGRVVP